MKQRVLSIFVAYLVLFTAFPVSSYAEPKYNLKIYDAARGTLLGATDFNNTPNSFQSIRLPSIYTTAYATKNCKIVPVPILMYSNFISTGAEPPVRSLSQYLLYNFSQGMFYVNGTWREGQVSILLSSGMGFPSTLGVYLWEFDARPDLCPGFGRPSNFENVFARLTPVLTTNW